MNYLYSFSRYCQHQVIKVKATTKFQLAQGHQNPKAGVDPPFLCLVPYPCHTI